MAWHFAFMWLFAFNGICCTSSTRLLRRMAASRPEPGSFREAWKVVLHDLHLSKRTAAARKFNGAQRFAYTGVIAMGAGSLLTGLAIYKPVQVAWLTTMLGGYEWARF